MAEAFKGKGPAPSVPWSDRLHILNTGTQKELDYQRQLLTYKLKEKQVKVQPLKSSGSRFWSDSADIEQMHMDEVALEAHVNFLEAKDKGGSQDSRGLASKRQQPQVVQQVPRT